MANKMPKEKRPVCSCGEHMVFVEFDGYYDTFWFWECQNGTCLIEDEMEKYEPDETVKGNVG